MKTAIGIICIVAPVVAACWDIIGPAVKKVINPLKQKKQYE